MCWLGWVSSQWRCLRHHGCWRPPFFPRNQERPGRSRRNRPLPVYFWQKVSKSKVWKVTLQQQTSYSMKLDKTFSLVVAQITLDFRCMTGEREVLINPGPDYELRIVEGRTAGVPCQDNYKVPKRSSKGVKNVSNIFFVHGFMYDLYDTSNLFISFMRYFNSFNYRCWSFFVDVQNPIVASRARSLWLLNWMPSSKCLREKIPRFRPWDQTCLDQQTDINYWKLLISVIFLKEQLLENLFLTRWFCEWSSRMISYLLQSSWPNAIFLKCMQHGMVQHVDLFVPCGKSTLWWCHCLTTARFFRQHGDQELGFILLTISPTITQQPNHCWSLSRASPSKSKEIQNAQKVAGLRKGPDQGKVSHGSVGGSVDFGHLWSILY